MAMCFRHRARNLFSVEKRTPLRRTARRPRTAKVPTKRSAPTRACSGRERGVCALLISRPFGGERNAAKYKHDPPRCRFLKLGSSDVAAAFPFSLLHLSPAAFSFLPISREMRARQFIRTRTEVRPSKGKRAALLQACPCVLGFRDGFI